MKPGKMTATYINNYLKKRAEKFKGKSYEVIQAINAYKAGDITLERLFEISKQ